MQFILPMPPSANRYWRNVRGIMLVSKEARLYKKAVAQIAMAQRAKAFAGEVCVWIDVYRKQKSGDLDNRIKVVLDSIKGAAFKDDKQVVEIHARRFEDKDNPRVEIRVEQADTLTSAAVCEDRPGGFIEVSRS